MPDARRCSPRPTVDRFAVVFFGGVIGITLTTIVAALWRICGGG